MQYTYFSDSSTGGNNSSPGGFNSATYVSDIEEKRTDLDTRLNELYKQKKIKETQQQKQIDANVYANIMLTVLGTCLLYFSFVKIIK